MQEIIGGSKIKTFMQLLDVCKSVNSSTVALK